MLAGLRIRPRGLRRAPAALLALAMGLALAGPVHGQAVDLAPPEVDTGGLHVAGNQLLNAENQPVQLHGANFSSTARDCIHPEWGNIMHEGPPDPQLIALLKSWNINALRIMLNEDCWLGIHGTPFYPETYQADIADLVDVLTKHNIAVILTLVYATPDNTWDTVLAGSGGRQWPMAVWPESGTFWRSVAQMFKANSRVLFDLYNEPALDNDHSLGSTGATTAAWNVWRDGGYIPPVRNYVVYRAEGMQQMTDIVRGTGAGNVIVISGLVWASDLSRYDEFAIYDPLGQIVLGKHLYNDGLACQTVDCFQNVLGPLMQEYPLLITEFAEMDCGHDFIDTVMNYFDSPDHQAGYLAHDLTPNECTGPALISDWNGTPTYGYGEGYKAHLMKLRDYAIRGSTR